MSCNKRFVGVLRHAVATADWDQQLSVIDLRAEARHVQKHPDYRP
jgi:hypothetical protein